MKIKELINNLKNLDPEMEINDNTDVDIGNLSNADFLAQMKAQNPDDSKPLRGKRARRIYFYERPDGVIVQLDERQAYTVQYEYNPAWKQIGSSDGRMFWEMTAEARKKLHEAEMVIFRKESHKLIPTEEEYLALEEAREEFEKVKAEALAAELAAARGHIHPPANNQWIGDPRAVKVAKNRLGIGIQE
jgi:hypothetical protein